MKKILPIILAIILFGISLTTPFSSAYATQLTQDSAGMNPPNAVPTGGLWVVDPEVTFIGKNAARSGLSLDWTLQNYQWVCVTKVADRNCDNTNNPLAQFWWSVVQWIVLPLLILVILATSMIIIISRGRSLTIMRFIPRFTAVLILIALSYAILQFLYQFTDLIQGFFLRSGQNTCPPDCISQADLLYVGWKYQNFVGLRLLGDYNAESAFISLLLTKLTALTYFVMVGILIIRKIILWFFIIVSPIFPLLLLFYPVRNTGKIWIGEFFRWLLYGPLFAIFLQGLVFMWRQAIPLQFANPAIQDPTQIIFPTAVNILLGGPKQFVTPTNSVNLTETFMLYVVALIMLWMVILLPWILLQIFLDYSAQFAGDSAMMKNLLAVVSNKMVPPSSPSHPTPPGSQPGGTAISLPFTKKKIAIPTLGPSKLPPTGAAKEINIESQGTTINQTSPIQTSQSSTSQPISMPAAQINAEVINLANIPLPTLRDISRYDSALISNNESQKEEVTQIRSMLEKIGNPASVQSVADRERFTKMNDRIVQESQQGNIVANNILNAINSAVSNQSQRNISATDSSFSQVLQQIASPASASSSTIREEMTKIHELLERESKENNNQLASTILSVTDKTTATELDKIRDQLVRERSVGNSVASTVTNSVKTAQIKSVLQQVANPALSSNPVQREKMSKLHDMLERESKESNNSLASSILQVKDTTSQSELEKISEKLEQTKDSNVSSQVLTSINSSMSHAQSVSKTKSVLQQVANPNLAASVDKEKMSKLHEALTKESQMGSEMASSILSVNKSTSTADIEKLTQRLQDAKEKGVAVAGDVLAATASQANIKVPESNRIQQVTAEELEEIKSMWKQNYNNMEVPEGMVGSRTEWIKDDIEKIDNVIGLLNSEDQEKVNQGLSEVGNILPFLLAGGFSQADIVSYLQAKQSAAKDVLASISAEEETKVTVETKKAEATQAMAATIQETPSTSSAAPSSSIEVSAPEVTVDAPQVSNEIMTMVNLKVPRMRDIARFDTMAITKDKSKLAEIEKVRETLTGIANPSSISITTDREKFDKLREKLMEESRKGNMTAGMVLNAANAVSSKASLASIQEGDIKNILKQIANPSLIGSESDRKVFTDLNEKLKSESQNSNELASSILSVNDSTSSDELKKIKEQLEKSQAAGESLSSMVISTVSKSVQNQKVKQVLTQIANPSQATSPADHERMAKLHESISKASKEGNSLATSILSVSKSTSSDDLEKLTEKLNEAKLQGEEIATSVNEELPQAVSIPQSNLVQQVTQEELDEVKNMWKQNYSKMEMPEGVGGNRTDWIKEDIGKIDSLVDLLKSSDADKVNQGISEVSNILPFLLVGGFSQTEIISYLQAKQEAAKEVFESLNKEEETKVTVEVKRDHSGSQTMAASIADNDTSSLTSVPTSTPAKQDVPMVSEEPQVSDEIFTSANLKMPKMSDIARYEAISLSRDKTKTEELQKVSQILTNISSPANIQTPEDRQKIEQLRDKLMEEGQKGNDTAKLLLNAASIYTRQLNDIKASLSDIKVILANIANPEISPEGSHDFYNRLHEYLLNEKNQKNSELAEKILSVTSETKASDIENIKLLLINQEQQDQAASQVIDALRVQLNLQRFKDYLLYISDPSQVQSAQDKEVFSKLHDHLSDQANQGNQIAKEISSVNKDTTTEEIDKIKKDILEASKNNDQLSQALLSAMSSSIIPDDNRLQPVTEDDYSEVEKMWEDNYRTLPVPFGFNDNQEGRISWIERDVQDINKTLDLLRSPDTEKKNEGMQGVGTILPFLLLGGFSFHEIINYLNVKLQAANKVLSELKQNESNTEKVDIPINNSEQQKSLEAEEENKN